ncbi:methyl-accepting chemotaxis protein [Pleomorphomonas koreensis]|uniref:methyl-accepting chemotaxis protein n=1 Tax=Pleomorphomonas koreensis TaxID=257440 RepID=UPI000406FE76|nr:methyl-accepting chemotaxis protein [Pleomorphomonas koreensis]
MRFGQSITAQLSIFATLLVLLSIAAGGAGFYGLVRTGDAVDAVSRASTALAGMNGAASAIQSLYLTGRSADAEAALAGIAAVDAAMAGGGLGDTAAGLTDVVRRLEAGWRDIRTADAAIGKAFAALSDSAARLERQAESDLAQAEGDLADVDATLDGLRATVSGLADAELRLVRGRAAFEAFLRTGEARSLGDGQDALSTAARLAYDARAENAEAELVEPLTAVAGLTADLYKAVARGSDGSQSVDLAARWPDFAPRLLAADQRIDAVGQDIRARSDKAFYRASGLSVRRDRAVGEGARARAFRVAAYDLLLATDAYRRMPDKAGEAAIGEALSGADAAAAALGPDAAKGVTASLDAYRTAAAGLVRTTQALQAARSGALDLSAAATDGLRRLAGQATAAADHDRHRTSLLVLIGIAGIVCVAAVVTRLLNRRIARPIRALTRLMHELADGKLDVAVPERRTRDEIAAMGEALVVFQRNGREREELRRDAERQQALRERRRAELERAIAAFDVAADDLIANVEAHAGRLGRGTAELTAAAGHAATLAERSSLSAGSAAESVRTMAAAAAELAQSQMAARHQADAAVAVAVTGADRARAASGVIAGLSDTTARIGEVVDLIGSIAAQTNLLALNATIEAARAGEAGKGFSVVAGEVKSLASQTTRATVDIRALIDGVGAATQSAVTLIRDIAAAMTDIDAAAALLSQSVVAQGEATTEISAGAAMASASTDDIAGKTVELAGAAGQTQTVAAEVLETTDRVNAEIARMRGLVEAFTRDARAA